MEVARPIIRGEIWTNTLTLKRVRILHINLSPDPREDTEVEYEYFDIESGAAPWVQPEMKFRQWFK